MLRSTVRLSCLLALCLSLWSCTPKAWNPGQRPTESPRLQAIRFADPIRPVAGEPQVDLRGARNETVHFAIQINKLANVADEKFVFWDLKKPPALRLEPLKLAAGTSIPISSITAHQVLPVPIEANRAGFVRHTAMNVAEHRLPRALLPLPLENNLIHLGGLRDPAAATDPTSHPRQDGVAPIVWIDIRIPPTVPPGEYHSSCELLEGGKRVASIPIRLVVNDFVIPDQHHLLMAGLVDWKSLERLYPDRFKGIMPNLLSRQDPKHAAAIRTLDQIVKLAQAHRLQVIVPRLQPTVKWPNGKPPQVDWSDFDSIVTPWLTGSAFADTVPLGYWPLPAIDDLQRHELASQIEYWQAAAAHFDQMEWLARSSVAIERRGSGRIRLDESVEISQMAAKLLALHPGLRVTVPLTEELVQCATPQNPTWIRTEDLGRLQYVAAGLVSIPPIQRLPDTATMRWLRTDLPGLIPYIGAGVDEREVRLWAWLAFLRGASLIQWPSIMPTQSDPATPSEVDELVWFYPGAWFGVDHPVPTVQLKWLRRAQQDYEYLWLARQREQGERALALARLIVRPVELQPIQPSDQVYGLMSGTSDMGAWDEAMSLLTRTILLSQPGQSIDPEAEKRLAYDMTGWAQTQDRPLMMARSAEWLMGVRDRQGDQWLNLRLGLDIYNAAERQPDRNTLKWASVPEGWSARSEMTDVPKLGTYSINRFPLEARIDLDKVTPGSRQPAKVTFVDGYTGKPFTLELMAPVAWCERRDGAPPRIDGSLGDWMQADALHEGKLVQMLSRPSVQQQELRFASTSSAVYSTWTASNLYLAFKVEGADAPLSNAETSFVRYDLRRAWGEDICEILMQAIYEDGSAGPLLHVACKPRGQIEMSRRLDPKLNANPWQAFAGAEVRYAANVDQSVWRGEIVIPWEAINPPGAAGKRPVLLRFNFAQHRGVTGQSASWAGPIDFARDEAMTGVLHIREAK